VIEDRVKQINETGKVSHKGITMIPNMDYWLGYDVGMMHADGLTRATTDWKDLIREDFPVHLVAIPTEKSDDWEHKPYSGYLEDVIKKICSYKHMKKGCVPLVIIESTLSANVLDDVVIPLIEREGLKVGEDIMLGVAPRRDWFTDGGKNLKTIPRVVGGTDRRTTDLMADVLGIICDTILKAENHKHAAIVKSIENAYRQVEITLANQLSAAYPDVNMREVLRLVGTKWNIGTYHPSFGIGGYCIPLAPHYVLEGAKNPDKLTILKHSIEFDSKQPDRVVDYILKKGAYSVGVLGVAYMADLKVHILSPAIKIIRALSKAGVNVKVNDPYYTDEELHNITKAGVFSFPEGLAEFDTILINADHMKYRYTPYANITKSLKKCKLILDNNGAWKKMRLDEIEYHEAGDRNWLG
jgi:nucleotide sugar dehydrogenase